MHAFRFFVDAGGLMSYGATQLEIYTMAAEQVAKILARGRASCRSDRPRDSSWSSTSGPRGAWACDPAVSLLLRADEVIQ